MNKVKRGPVDCANNVVRAEADIFSLTSSFVRNGWQKKGKCDDGSDLTSFNIYTSVPRPAKTTFSAKKKHKNHKTTFSAKKTKHRTHKAGSAM